MAFSNAIMPGMSVNDLSSPEEAPGSSHNIQKRMGAANEGSAPARKRQLLTRSNEGSNLLCERCRDIDWAGLAAPPPATKRGRPVADLPCLNRQVLNQLSCSICRLLFQVVPGDLEGKDCYLRAFASSLAILGREVRAPERKQHSDCTVIFPVLKDKSDDKTEGGRIARDWHEAGFLALVNGGEHQRLPDTGPRKRQMSSVVDPKLMKGWLEYCEKHHESCRKQIGGSDCVRGLRLIDCESGKTDEAPARCTYLALSYVWGKPTQNENPEGGAVDWPRVVQGALEVTRSLGERYLWVDQYCIDQTPGPSKSEQIAQMDKIYSGARLTLVAAAGENSSYGLPGVGTKERFPMQRYTIDNVVITQMPPHLSSQISRSTWAERGWTYQEGYLSPRRLIFTDYEVAYLCNTMHYTESIQKSELLTNSERKAETSNFLEMIPNTAGPQWRWWDQLKNEQLPNYTRRKLTKASDSVNAILGLFHTLGPGGIRHLHGIPIRRVPRMATLVRVELCLAWHHDTLAKRFPEFPSWSWSGWVGGIPMSEPDIRDSDVRQIALVQEDGGTVPLNDWFNRMYSQDPASIAASKLLRISALTVWVSFEKKKWADLNEQSGTQSKVARMSFIDGTHAILPIDEDTTALCYAYMDENVSLVDGALGLILEPKSQKRRYSILLLRPDGDHYQRIGLVRVSSYNKTRPAAVRNSDPPIVYVNREGIPKDGFTRGDEPALWLQTAVEKTVTIS